jgi:hypothetical protein
LIYRANAVSRLSQGKTDLLTRIIRRRAFPDHALGATDVATSHIAADQLYSAAAEKD